MSNLRQRIEKDGEKPLIVLISDLHLDDTPPSARGETQSQWITAQYNYLMEVYKLSKELDNIQISVAGDVFNRWDVRPEVIRMAIDAFRKMRCVYMIPGQHDLPNHDLGQKGRSAYSVLCKGSEESIVDLSECERYTASNHVVQGFPFGAPIRGCAPIHDIISIAVVHKYVWALEYNPAHQGEESSSANVLNTMYGYDVIHTGDNHQYFHHTRLAGKNEKLRPYTGSCVLFNAGTFMRRRSDEIDYRPRIGVVTNKGIVHDYLPDVSKDKFVIKEPKTKIEDDPTDMAEALAAFQDLTDSKIKFKEAVARYINKEGIDPQIARLIHLYMDKNT